MSDHVQQPLILRHRPQTFAEVRGHDAVLGPLQRRLAEAGAPHAYLLTGPSGVGKTTIARLIGNQLGCDLTEVDAATHSGVDAMRDLTEFGHIFSPLSANRARMLIIDECHRLSHQAWDAALKAIEEPPDHLYWALATTELDKVPTTIQTGRTYHVPLGRLPDRVIEEFLLDIIIAEEWTGVVKPEVFRLVAQEAEGSPRQALALLNVCFDVAEVDEARRIISLQGSPEPLMQVMRLLVEGRRGLKWETVRPLLAQLDAGEFSERTLIRACDYVIACLHREGVSEERALSLWGLLAALTYPARGFSPRAVFYRAIGQIILERPDER